MCEKKRTFMFLILDQRELNCLVLSDLIQIFICGFINEFMNHEKPTRNISKTAAMVLSISDKLQWMAITQIESVNNCYILPAHCYCQNQCTYCSCYVVNSMCCHNLIMATPLPPSQNYYAPQLGLHEGDDHHEAFKIWFIASI